MQVLRLMNSDRGSLVVVHRVTTTTLQSDDGWPTSSSNTNASHRYSLSINFLRVCDPTTTTTVSIRRSVRISQRLRVVVVIIIILDHYIRIIQRKGV